MKREKIRIGNNCIIAVFVIALFITESCGLKEIGEIDEVKVKTDTRVLLPLAYGNINMQTLIDYVNRDDLIFQADSNGYFSFEPTVNYYNFPDTFAFQGSMLDVLSQLELRIETENGLPLGIKVALSFADSVTLTEFGPQIVYDLTKPAAIDQNGKVTEASHHVDSIILTKEDIFEYRNANAIFAKFNFFLPETDHSTILINRKDSLTLNIGVVIQAKSNEN